MWRKAHTFREPKETQKPNFLVTEKNGNVLHWGALGRLKGVDASGIPVHHLSSRNSEENPVASSEDWQKEDETHGSWSKLGLHSSLMLSHVLGLIGRGLKMGSILPTTRKSGTQPLTNHSLKSHGSVGVPGLEGSHSSHVMRLPSSPFHLRIHSKSQARRLQLTHP